MIATDGKQLVIVTFRPKEKRKDQSDKVQIARRMISGIDRILDINLYDAPILNFQATEQEIERLRNDVNIAAVEEDGICKATGDGPKQPALVPTFPVRQRLPGEPIGLLPTYRSGTCWPEPPARWVILGGIRYYGRVQVDRAALAPSPLPVAPLRP